MSGERWEESAKEREWNITNDPGISWQLHDDIHKLTGQPEIYGKPSASPLLAHYPDILHVHPHGDDLENPQEEEEVRLTIRLVIDVPQTRLFEPRPALCEATKRLFEAQQHDYILGGESPPDPS
nr:hypothetical protein Iba_chr09dCG12940 [Ipomoea batatas]